MSKSQGFRKYILSPTVVIVIFSLLSVFIPGYSFASGEEDVAGPESSAGDSVIADTSSEINAAGEEAAIEEPVASEEATEDTLALEEQAPEGQSTGEEITGELRVLAPAIPPAEVKADLVPKSKTTSGVDVDLVTVDGNDPVVITGIEEAFVNIHFQIPENLSDGEYTLRFNVINDQDVLLAQKEYVCNVGDLSKGKAATKDGEMVKEEVGEPTNAKPENAISGAVEQAEDGA